MNPVNQGPSQNHNRQRNRRFGSGEKLRWRSPSRLGLRKFAVAGLLAFFGAAAALATESNQTLQAWFSAQTNIHTWSADVTQTRTLKTLTQPLTATGHVWFAAPNRFRWEIGNPPQTIALRQADQLLVIYPRFKRVERYPLMGDQTGPWKDTLALLEAGFPSSQAELESRFRIVSQSGSNDLYEITLQPRSAAARRMMPEMKIAFSPSSFVLRSTELQFADGSRMRNDFTNPVLNPKLDENLFAPKLESDYEVTEPLKR